MSIHTDKKKRRRVKKFRLDEISLVDKPAHAPARIAIMKREADTPDVIQKNRMALTTLTAGHAHSIILVQAHSESMAELRAGQTSFVDGHSHDWIMDDAGNIIIGDNDGHSHGLSALVKAADDVTNETLTEGILAADDQSTNQASVTKTAVGGTESITMTPEDKAAFEKAADDKLALETSRADLAEEIIKLSPSQRGHYDALDSDDGRSTFLKAEDKDAIVKNATDSDPVVFTDEDSGIVLRKSADPVTLALAKQNKQHREELAQERSLRKAEDLVKRSGDLLKNCTGTPSAKAALLGAIETIGDAELRKSVLEIVTAKDAGLQKAFETLGTSDDGNGNGADANAKLEALAKSYHKDHPNLTEAQAYTEALFTPEGQQLHSQL